MVETTKFSRKMKLMRTEVREDLVRSVERNAEKVCVEMRVVLAITNPEVAAWVEIDWTWGETPKGAVTVGTIGGKERSELAVTIYATTHQGSGFSAAWFEFGTAERVQTTTGRRVGRITASPFFFPVYRANKQRVLNSIRASLRRAVKKLNA